jgi:hypothetical protein
MHGFDLWLLVLLAAALAAGAWGIARWKWYGVIPAVVLGFLAFAAASYGHLFPQKFVDQIVSSTPSERVLLWLLGSAATLVALTSIWAGYSRGYWFWRLSSMAGILALLATIDAKEPILLCLATMPFIAGGAWLIRGYQERARDLRNVPPEEQRNRRARWRWPLRDSLLVFVVVGLLAVTLRRLNAGDVYLVGQDFLVSGLAFIAVCLAATGAGVARNPDCRRMLSILTIIAAVGGFFVHQFLGCDALGILYYFDTDSRDPLELFVLQALGATIMTTAIVVFGRLYTAVMCGNSLSRRRLAGGLLAVTAVALTTPLAIVYPRMIPPATKITPLSPSMTYDRIQLAGQKATGLHTVGFKAAPVVKETKAALAEPGNVWFDIREFRKNELSLRYHRSFDRESMLNIMLLAESAKAEEAGRFSECLELAILQWRLGRVLRHGGVYMDWGMGYTAESYGCGTVSHVADKLSDDECRRGLVEVHRSLEDRPDVATVWAYHNFWYRGCFGWRNDLFHSALWLVGENPNVLIPEMDKQRFQNLDKRGLVRLQLMETRLALELFRREHGKWPSGLQDLVPKYLAAIPADPFSKSSLIYRRQGDSFLLYSVGPDGRDDGCRLSSKEYDMKLEGFDIDWDLDHRVQSHSWPRQKQP